MKFQFPVSYGERREWPSTNGATYFTCLRDSLRNILLDIDTFIEERNLLSSDAFWRAFLSKAIHTKKTETQLWDFKETLPMWRMENGPDKERAKLTFAEDVAAASPPLVRSHDFHWVRNSRWPVHLCSA